MWRVSEWARRAGMLIRRGRFERDLRDEMRFHLELREREQRDSGLPPAEAQAAARRRFGNDTLLRETSRDIWSWQWLEHILQDLRYGVRALVRAPGFTAVAVIALALGIGANTAIFSVVNAVLLNPLAYKDADRLVTILHDGSGPVSAANYIDWRDQSHSFEAAGAAEYWSPNLTNDDPAEHLLGLRTTQSLLPMLGVQPLLGRLFVAGEDQPGSDHEVVLSYQLWLRRFGGNPGALGSKVTLNGETYTIVGVMPRGFHFAPFWATHAELWAPLAFGDRIHDRGSNSLRVFARLKKGVTLAQARAEMATITARLEKQYPATNANVVVTPLKQNVVGKIETPLLMLLGSCGFVLLIACANVAHMLLARTSDRQREIAVRTALGADRGRVMAQFMTENLLLAGMGALAGLALAWAGIKALVMLSPAYIPRVETVAIDARVLLFLVGMTALTAIAFGLVPAVQTGVWNLSAALKEGGRGDSDSVRRSRLRSFLVASEFTLAFVLLIGAGLMIRSFIALQSVDPGFNPHQVLSMVVSVAGSKEAAPGQREVFYRNLLERVRRLPGVLAAGGINHLPLAGDLWGRGFDIEGRPKPRPGEVPVAVYRIAMPGYFETMRLPVLRGRAISARDDARAPRVVVINERAARDYWPGQDPLGKRIKLDDDKDAPSNWLTIIGVVKNAKQLDWALDPYPEVYLSGLQAPDFLGDEGVHIAYITLVVRTDGNPAGLASGVKNLVWSVDRNLPVSQVLTMDQAVSDANAQPRFEMLLLSVFAGVALTLAALGIYGVMSYSVSRRIREIGIRISLGASRVEVMRMVIRQGMTQVLGGTVAGIAGALLLSKVTAKLLYGVQPSDPVTFCTVAVVLGVAALFATLIPARRAMRIEPMVALRND